MERIPQCEEDRHLKTFYTKWGRYRYRSAPQGYQSSGDAYTHRYDKITMGIKDVKRVIDDTLLYATDMVGAFKPVAEYLTLWVRVLLDHTHNLDYL